MYCAFKVFKSVEFKLSPLDVIAQLEKQFSSTPTSDFKFLSGQLKISTSNLY